MNFTKDDLLERILSPANLNKAYKQVLSNGGSGGVDKMETEELLPFLKLHKDKLVTSLMDGNYHPNPVRRVEIPKDNGKKRQLGIPTVVDRLIQQAISRNRSVHNTSKSTGGKNSEKIDCYHAGTLHGA